MTPLSPEEEKKKSRMSLMYIFCNRPVMQHSLKKPTGKTLCVCVCVCVRAQALHAQYL